MPALSDSGQMAGSDQKSKKFEVLYANLTRLSTVQGHLHNGTSYGAEARAGLGGASVELVWG